MNHTFLQTVLMENPYVIRASQVPLEVNNLPADAGDVRDLGLDIRDLGLIPGSRKIP